MTTRRQSDQCLNCGHTLEHNENYCPSCGQENREIKIGFGQLVSEFLSNYLALDTRIGRSIVPFLIKPGFLTIEFNRGKRKNYLNPVRLYLAMSILYFFVLSLLAGRIVPTDKAAFEIQTDDVAFFENTDRMTREILNSTLSEKTLDKLRTLDSLDQGAMIDTLSSILSKAEMKELEGAFGKNLQNLNLSQQLDPDSTQSESKETLGLVLELNDGDIDFGRLNNYKNNLSLSDQDVVDSISTGELSSFENKVAIQMVKLARSRTDAVLQIIVNNFPLMMLLLIPLFAGILKLLYLGSERLYIEHVIHALHLHAFAYFSYGIILLFLLIPEAESSFGKEIAIIGFFLVTFYAFRSFQKVYKGKWGKTLLRFLAVGMIYSVAILFFFLVEVLISLYLF